MEPNNAIYNELASISSLLASMPTINVYTVPANYFENNETAIVKALNATQPPTGYFDRLAPNIIAKIKLNEQLPLNTPHSIPSILTAIQHINVFKVPNQYFSTLPTVILQKIVTLVDATFEVLKNTHKKNTLSTPTNYFENLSGQIIVKAKSSNAVVIKNTTFKKWYKYAAAAILTAIVSFSILKFTANTKQQPILEASIETGKNMDDKKFNEAINNLNEDDIAQYLANTSTDADVAIIATSIDENNVPAKDDYLIDEKTLEKFLTDIEPTNAVN